MTKVKITYTMEADHDKYVKAIAVKHFEGNDSMAIRYIISEHSRTSKIR